LAGGHRKGPKLISHPVIQHRPIAVALLIIQNRNHEKVETEAMPCDGGYQVTSTNATVILSFPPALFAFSMS